MVKTLTEIKHQQGIEDGLHDSCFFLFQLLLFGISRKDLVREKSIHEPRSFIMNNDEVRHINGCRVTGVFQVARSGHVAKYRPRR